MNTEERKTKTEGQYSMSSKELIKAIREESYGKDVPVIFASEDDSWVILSVYAGGEKGENEPVFIDIERE